MDQDQASMRQVVNRLLQTNLLRLSPSRRGVYSLDEGGTKGWSGSNPPTLFPNRVVCLSAGCSPALVEPSTFPPSVSLGVYLPISH